MSDLLSLRAAVIGGTGFLGTHLVSRLAAGGASVLSVSRNGTASSPLVTAASCDIMDQPALARVLHAFQPDVVYHMAAHPDAAETCDHMRSALLVNTTGVVNSIEAAHEAGAALFVLADSSKVYGNGPVPYTVGQKPEPVCSYAVAKVAAWNCCQIFASHYGIAVASLRPTMIYGPGQGWNLLTYLEKCVREGRPVRLMGGQQTRDPLFISDAVEAFCALPSHREAWGHAIPIGGGIELTVANFACRVLQSLGSDARIQVDPASARSTEIWRSVSGNAEAAELLDWKPRISLEEGLLLTFQEQQAAIAA